MKQAVPTHSRPAGRAGLVPAPSGTAGGGHCGRRAGGGDLDRPGGGAGRCGNGRDRTAGALLRLVGRRRGFGGRGRDVPVAVGPGPGRDDRRRRRRLPGRVDDGVSHRQPGRSPDSSPLGHPDLRADGPRGWSGRPRVRRIRWRAGRSVGPGWRGRTLSVYQLVLNDAGGYDLTSYARTLDGRGDGAGVHAAAGRRTDPARPRPIDPDRGSDVDGARD